MSKISITPNASGTGVFTISSPATNTDRTLTLPDEAGTVLTSASSLASANLTGTVAVSGSNVGIGTTSPDKLLHLKTSVNNTAVLRIESTAANSYPHLSLKNDAREYQLTAHGPLGDVFTIYDGTAGSHRFVIDSSGNVLVGTTDTSPASNDVAGSLRSSTGLVQASVSGNPCLFVNRKTNDGAVVSIRRAGSQVGSISVTGSSTAYNTSSDYRLKTDAQPMVGASDRVLALKPVNFEWISDGSRVDGFLAHEAQAVVPECVTGTKDGMRDEEYEVTAAVLDADGMVVTEAVMGTRSVPDMQGIDQSKLVPLLTAALQEALTEISALKVRVAALEAV